ncbi:MAG: hypothetical protein VB876_13390, partial [Pirellulales bacterium]
QQPLVVEYQLDGLAPLATNAAASWQVIERLTGGDHQVQRVNLTAASGDVTGSFTLEYDENQVTVNLGADDEATRSNIENALEGIANPRLDVAVAPAGAGVFDIRFLKPAAADVLELELGGVGGLAGLAGSPDISSLDYAIDRTQSNYAVFPAASANNASDFYISPFMAVDQLGPRVVEKPVWADLDGDGTVEQTDRTDFFEDPTWVTDKNVDQVTINGSAQDDYFTIGHEVLNVDTEAEETKTDTIKVTHQRLIGGLPAPVVDEVQRVDLRGATGGTFGLALSDAASGIMVNAADIAVQGNDFDTAEAIKTALNASGRITVGVEASSPGIFDVTIFRPAATNVAQMTISSSLSGETGPPQISTQADGLRTEVPTVLVILRGLDRDDPVQNIDRDEVTVDASGGSDRLIAGFIPNSTEIRVNQILRAPAADLLELKGGPGDDYLVGSRFADIISSGVGNDTVTGNEGIDQFNDASASSETDTLMEARDLDVTLSDNELRFRGEQRSFDDPSVFESVDEIETDVPGDTHSGIGVFEQFLIYGGASA